MNSRMFLALISFPFVLMPMDSNRLLPAEWLQCSGAKPLAPAAISSLWQYLDANDDQSVRVLLHNVSIKDIKRPTPADCSHFVLKDTPLLTAINDHSSLSLIQTLLDHDANINEIGIDGLPPVAKSILFGQTDVTKLLIHKGARLGVPFTFNTKQLTVLQLAELMNQREIVALIKKNLGIS